MRVSRVFVDQDLSLGQTLALPDDASHYLGRVLRLRPGDAVVVFNGQGGEYTARLLGLDKKTARLSLEAFAPLERESPLRLVLAQGIAKPAHMDFLLQKAAELGVSEIVPVVCARSQHFDPQQKSKRAQHWYKILVSACEQCGRNRLPQLHPAQELGGWLEQTPAGAAAVLDPETGGGLRGLAVDGQLTLLVGPEGGLDATELDRARRAGYVPAGLGPRILRTETAALSAVTLAQGLWGDL